MGKFDDMVELYLQKQTNAGKCVLFIYNLGLYLGNIGKVRMLMSYCKVLAVIVRLTETKDKQRIYDREISDNK